MCICGQDISYFGPGIYIYTWATLGGQYLSWPRRIVLRTMLMMLAKHNDIYIYTYMYSIFSSAEVYKAGRSTQNLKDCM